MLLVACGDETDVPAQDIVSTIPWDAPAAYEYVLLDGGGYQVATGEHTIEREGGNFVLRTHYESPEGNSDTTTIVVDGETLKPISSERFIDNDNPDDEDRIQVEYTQEGALISTGEGDRQSGLSLEEHHYDNDTSLFLWRTIDFREGYESSYYTVITNRRTQQRVVLRVTGKETVTVPAGEFEAWRLEILTTNARQVAWYADTPERTLVRYDNSLGTIFELTSAP